MKMKKVIAYSMLCGLLASSFAPMNKTQVYGGSMVENKKDTKEEMMSKALRSVKEKVEIPSDYNSFDYYFSDNDDTSYWKFIWGDNVNDRSIQIRADEDGNIRYYIKVSRFDDSRPNIVKYYRQDLKKKADEFIRKVAKNEFDDLKYDSCEYYYYNGSYCYHYERMKDGVKVADNDVEVSLDATTGEVVSYRSNWNYQATFTKEKIKITKEKAKELIKKSLNMKLEYHDVYQDGTIKEELIYTPDQTYLAVDAISGELYHEKFEVLSDITGEAKYDKAINENSSRGFTKEEQVKIDELKELLTQDEVITKLEKEKNLLFTRENMNVDARLYQKTNDLSVKGKKRYVWELTFVEEEADNDDFNQYIIANVDAKDGTLLSYYYLPKTYNDKSEVKKNVKYTKKQGLNVANDFIKSNFSNSYDKYEYDESKAGYQLYYSDLGENYGGEVYCFTRRKDGIPVASNTITVGVDLISGKIYDIDYIWYEDVPFEKNKSTMTQDMVKDQYLSFDGFELVYENNMNLNNVGEVNTRLVYRTDMNPYCVDAISGKQCDYYGNESKKQCDYDYLDLNDSRYKQEITLLGQMGIGFETDLLEPSKAIMRDEFDQLFESWYGDQGIVLSEVENPVTREEAAKQVVELLGYEKVAKLNVYKDQFKDSKEINQGYLGYVVLADAFGLIEGKENDTFAPKAYLSREEALHMLYVYLTLR